MAGTTDWGLWTAAQAPRHPAADHPDALLILFLLEGRAHWQIPELGRRTVPAGHWSLLCDHRPLSTLTMAPASRALWIRMETGGRHPPGTWPPKLECLQCPARNAALFVEGVCCVPSRRALRELPASPPHTMAGRLLQQAKVAETTARLLDRPEFQTAAPCHTSLCSRDIETVESIARYLQENLHRSHTMAQLARRFFINEFKLKKVFKAHYGQPVFSYLRQCRMHRAALLLEQQGYSVMEAAAAVGYSNPSHFARAFREVHGLNPGEVAPYPQAARTAPPAARVTRSP